MRSKSIAVKVKATRSKSSSMAMDTSSSSTLSGQRQQGSPTTDDMTEPPSLPFALDDHINTSPLGRPRKPTCLKCNKSDASLVVCLERTCPLAFHEDCFLCFASSDDLDDFYCPYCAYKRELAHSSQARQTSLSAKKALTDFIHTNLPAGTIHQMQQPPLNNSSSVVDENASKINQKDKTSNKSHQRQNGIKEGSGTADQESFALPTQNKIQAGNSSSALNTTGKDRDERVTTSLQNQHMKFASPILTSARRKRLIWTADEEDMLKEGVHKYSTTSKNIPWSKILEFGQHVFHGTRTPEDLKDKWKNNLAKKSSPLKKRSR